MSSAIEITALTIEEAAPRLKVAPKTLRKWLREGTFPGVKVGRKWLVRADDVQHALTYGRRGDHAVWVPVGEAGPKMPAPLPPHLAALEEDHRVLKARIREMHASGLTERRIANQLNKEGVPAGTENGRWDVDTVHSWLLTNAAVSDWTVFDSRLAHHPDRR